MHQNVLFHTEKEREISKKTWGAFLWDDPDPDQ